MELVEKAIRENCPYRYSLILTDCSMPFMDGYEASKRMRQLLQECLKQEQGGQDSERVDDRMRIIAITGHVEPEYVAKALAHGMDQVFPKPMPILELGLIMQE